MSKTAERPHWRPPRTPRSGSLLRCDSGPDRTALEVIVGFDKLSDLMDKWVDDIVNGD
jgi:hypothetical protein